jgi:hypothetical protein
MTPHYSDNPQRVSYAVEIKANGYLAEKQDIPAPLTNDSQANFVLRGAPALMGIVQTPGGERANAAAVFLLREKGEYVSMNVPGQFNFLAFRGTHVETDANGVFSIPTTSTTGAVCIAHNSGYSRVPLEQLAASRTVRLEPWGKVAGLLTIGNKPASNETIHLDSLADGDTPVPVVHLTTTTDAEGRFVMNGIPPDDQRISHGIKSGDGRTGRVPFSESVTVALAPGRITAIQLGETGRKLVGRIREKGPAHLVNWQNCSVDLTTELPGSAVPSRALFASREDYLLALKEWEKRKADYQRSPARRELREYVTTVGADGSFSFSNVVPGGYELRIIANHPPGEVMFDPSQGGMRDYFQLLSLVDGVVRQVALPASTGADATPFDLGVWEINLKNPGELH